SPSLPVPQALHSQVPSLYTDFPLCYLPHLPVLLPKRLPECCPDFLLRFHPGLLPGLHPVSFLLPAVHPFLNLPRSLPLFRILPLPPADSYPLHFPHFRYFSVHFPQIPLL